MAVNDPGNRGGGAGAPTPPRRFRQLKLGAGGGAAPGSLDGFSFTTGGAGPQSPLASLGLPFVLAWTLYVVKSIRHSRAGRIALLTAVLAVGMIGGSLLTVGVETVTHFVQTTKVEVDKFMGKDTLIAVLGTDDVPDGGVQKAPGRSDTLMLVNVQYENQKLRAFSIPRDTFVMVDYGRGRGLQGDKLAHAYRRGGLKKSLETLRRLTRLQVDHYLIVDYGLFRDFIDRIGGVLVDVEKRMYYEDRAGGLKIDFQPGPQVLSGQKALEYVRFRKDGQGDMGRIARQQRFLQALIDKLLDVRVLGSLLEPETISGLLKHLDTDILPSQVLPLGWRFARAGRQAFESKVLPGSHDARITRWSGQKPLSYFFVDRPGMDKLIDEWLLSKPRAEPTSDEARAVAEDAAIMAEVMAAPSGTASPEDLEHVEDPGP